MESYFNWIDVLFAIINQAIGYWICRCYAKREMQQLKSQAKVKVASIRNHLEESEELLERLSKDYPHLMQADPSKAKSPYVTSQWRNRGFPIK